MVVVKLQGGLGNQMFQYAAARCLAEKNNTSVGLDVSFQDEKTATPHFTYRKFCLNVFGLEKDICVNPYKKYMEDANHPVKKLTKILYSRLINFNYYCERELNFNPAFFKCGPNTYMEGYFQSENYFIKYEPLIRRIFSFAPLSDDTNQSVAKKIIATNSVSIHIRRGDFAEDPVINQTHGLLDISYYDRAIGLIAKKISSPYFFIFSDDPQWVKNNLHPVYPFEIVSCNKDESGYRDMQLMVMCRNNIIANSSFSWWGAWLNANRDKIIIAPSHWFTDEKKSAQALDIIPSQWVKI